MNAMSRPELKESEAACDVIPPLSLPMTVSVFPTAFPSGPAIGTVERTTWEAFACQLLQRRIGAKDGPGFIPATFKPECDGRVRRLTSNLLVRTAIALDCETNKGTGEMPPPFGEAVARIEALGWAAAVYTSHNHTPDAPRYRIVLPLDEEVPHFLPAPEVVAEMLKLRGVVDESKLGAWSLFYFPSAAPGEEARHAAEVIAGQPISGACDARARGCPDGSP
jgi:hypothetical protein